MRDFLLALGRGAILYFAAAYIVEKGISYYNSKKEIEANK